MPQSRSHSTSAPYPERRADDPGSERGGGRPGIAQQQGLGFDAAATAGRAESGDSSGALPRDVNPLRRTPLVPVHGRGLVADAKSHPCQEKIARGCVV